MDVQVGIETQEPPTEDRLDTLRRAATATQRATWVLNALRHHQAAETDLIFESFWTDIGTVD